MIDVTSAILQLQPQKHKQLSQCPGKLIIKMLNKHDIISFIKHITQARGERGRQRNTAASLFRGEGENALSTYAQALEIYLSSASLVTLK